jgi:hypothetical protein
LRYLAAFRELTSSSLISISTYNTTPHTKAKEPNMVQPPSSTQTAYVAPKPGLTYFNKRSLYTLFSSLLPFAGSAQQQLIPQPQQQAIPEDVRWIMRNSSGFWTRPHKYGPILEDERAAAGAGRKEVTAKAQMITAKPQTPVLNGNPPIRTQSQPHGNTFTTFII